MSPVQRIAAGATASSSLAWAAAFRSHRHPGDAIDQGARRPSDRGAGRGAAAAGSIALARGEAVEAWLDELERVRRPPREAGQPGGFSAYA